MLWNKVICAYFFNLELSIDVQFSAILPMLGFREPTSQKDPLRDKAFELWLFAEEQFSDNILIQLMIIQSQNMV